MNDRPDLSKRRTIIPAPDEGIDPIDPHKEPAAGPVSRPASEPAMATPAASVRAARTQPAKPKKIDLPTRDLNLQVTSEVMETIDFAKFKTKLTKREIVQRAVLGYWSEYRPNDT